MSKRVVGENKIERITGGTKARKAASWGLIIAMWFVFFPAALIMTMTKLKTEKHNYVSNGKATKITGIVWLVIAAIYTVTGITGNLEVTDSTASATGGIIMMDIICCAIGLPFFLTGKKYIKLGERNDRYIDLVTTGELNLDNMARAVGVTFEQVVKDLKEMIKDGYFKGAYIDEYSRYLVMPYSREYDNSNVNKDESIPQVRRENKVVKCPNCGATNTITVGVRNECEYCGTPLE